MSLFKNKHIVTAMIVTPVLAMLGYYVTDQFVKERPQAAIKGQSYELIAQSNCRYSSGKCDLKNAEFTSTLTVENDGGIQTLKLESSHPLAGATVGIVQVEKTYAPTKMNSANTGDQSWYLQMPANTNESTILRVALMANGSYYYAETPLGFSEYKTSFPRNF
jgi:hypothetical protein